MKFREKSEDSRNFLKLKESEHAMGIFRGEIFEFRVHWAENRSVVCPGKDHCELCKSGNKSKFRFRVNFVMKNGNEYAAKVIEQGWTFYETLRTLNKEYPLEKYVMKISRHGSGMNTTYTVLPIANGLLSETALQIIEKVALNELGHVTEAEKEPADLMPSDLPTTPAPLDDIPF